MSSLSKLLSDVWSTLTGIHAELRAIRQLLEVPPPPVNDEGAAKLAGCHVRTIRNIFSESLRVSMHPGHNFGQIFVGRCA